MKLFKKKSPETDTVQTNQAEKKSSQDWLPFYDVHGGFLYRRDEHLVAINRIEPLNMSLKADTEKKKTISALHEAFNPQTEPIHIYTIPRPVDLDSYLEHEQKKARDTTVPLRKRLYNEYVRYVAGIVHSGDAMERRFYMVMDQAPGKKQKEELLHQTYELKHSMAGCGLNVEVSDNSGILDMLFSFLQPGRAAYEMPPDGSANFVTIYKGGILDVEQK